MIEITNTQRGPVSVMIRSRKKLRSFTTLTIPGRGAGDNKRTIEDERATEYIAMVENFGLISTRKVKNK
jgi:hypothetical protein